MTRGLTRRQVGAGMFATAAITHLPVSAQALSWPPLDGLTGALRSGVDDLIAAYRAFERANRVYGRNAGWVGGPLAWGDIYGDLLAAHEELRSGITDDTPLERALLEWANRLGPPPCRQALAFWTPISGMSKKFAELHPCALETRARYALAKYDFWSKYPSGHPSDHDQPDDFDTLLNAMRDASDPWFRAREKVRVTWAETPGDHMLARRMVESFVTDDTIDVPYLRQALPDWKPYGEFPVLHRCPLSCVDCDRLQLPTSSDQEQETG